MRREQFDRELEVEMRFPLEMKAQENIEAGAKPEEARYAARRFPQSRLGVKQLPTTCRILQATTVSKILRRIPPLVLQPH